MTDQTHPFTILSEMAQASRQSAVGLPAQEEAQLYWSGIGFTLGGIRFVAPMDEVNEILRVPHFTRLPGVKPWVIGVANVRGRLVPIIELADFLGVENRSISRNRRILVIEIDEMLNGLIVDSVEGLQNIPVEDFVEQNVSDIPAQLENYVSGYYQRNRNKLSVFSMHNLVTSENFVAVAS